MAAPVAGGGIAQWLKNPWVLAGAAALFIVLVLASRGSATSAASSTGSLDLAAQQNSNATNVQLANIQGNVQMEQDQTAAAVSIATTNSNNATEVQNANVVGGIVANVLSLANNTSNNATMLQAQQQSIAGSITQNQQTLSAQEQLLPQLAQIQASIAVPLATVQGSTAVQLANINSATQENIANTNANAAVNKQLIASGGNVVSSSGGIGGILGDISDLF